MGMPRTDSIWGSPLFDMTNLQWEWDTVLPWPGTAAPVGNVYKKVSSEVSPIHMGGVAIKGIPGKCMQAGQGVVKSVNIWKYESTTLSFQGLRDTKTTYCKRKHSVGDNLAVVGLLHSLAFLKIHYNFHLVIIQLDLSRSSKCKLLHWLYTLHSKNTGLPRCCSRFWNIRVICISRLKSCPISDNPCQHPLSLFFTT